MLQVLSQCEANYDHTGASVVATIFLSVFVALILSDAVLTGVALMNALTKDERERELARQIKLRRDELETVSRELRAATDLAAKRNTATLVSVGRVQR